MNEHSLKRKLQRLFRESISPDVTIQVREGDDPGDEDYFLRVVSRSWADKDGGERGDIIGSVLFNNLPKSEWGKITLIEGLTPEEVKRIPSGFDTFANHRRRNKVSRS